MIGRDNLADKAPAYPEACPKCGATFLPGEHYRAQHFRSAHPGAIGVATLRPDPSFRGEFVYVSPAYQDPYRWNVVWMAAPFEVVKMTHGNYAIEWPGRTGRKEIEG